MKNNTPHTMTWVIASHPWGLSVNGWEYKCDKKYKVLKFESKAEAEKAMTSEDYDYGSVARQVVEELITE
mgnify:CR=1 FL=1